MVDDTPIFITYPESVSNVFVCDEYEKSNIEDSLEFKKIFN